MFCIPGAVLKPLDRLATVLPNGRLEFTRFYDELETRPYGISFRLDIEQPLYTNWPSAHLLCVRHSILCLLRLCFSWLVPLKKVHFEGSSWS